MTTDPGGRPPERAQASAAPSPHPFAGIPLSDYLRDGVAALLLFVSLALPWDYQHGASDRIEVVLVTAASVLSLALPYLSRVGVFPATWTVRTTRTARLLANLPYALLAVVYLVVDGVTGDGFSGGVGVALALGLAGAVLAAQPRRSELGPAEEDRAATEQWMLVVRVLTGLVAATVLVSFVLGLVTLADLGFSVGALVGLLADSVLVLALVAWPLLGTARRDAAWRAVLSALGVVFCLVFVIGASDAARLPQIQSLHFGGFGLVLLPAGAAAASAPGVLRGMRRTSGSERWVGAALRTFLVLAVVAVVTAVDAGVAVAEGASEAPVVIGLVLALLIAVAAVVGLSALRTSPAAGRGIALVLAGVVAVLGLVALVLAASDDYLGAVTYPFLLLALGLPATVAVVLLVPPSMRPEGAGRGPSGGLATAAYEWQPAEPVQPAEPTAPAGATAVTAVTAVTPAVPSVPPPPVPPVPPARFTAAQAVDPGTDAAVLAQIAQDAPTLRPYVAANPATYPALLEWLGRLGDPEVDAALRARPPRG